MFSKIKNYWSKVTASGRSEPINPGEHTILDGEPELNYVDFLSQRNAALFRLTAELASALDEQEICKRVVEGLHDTLGYDIYFPEDDLDRSPAEFVTLLRQFKANCPRSS